MGKDLNKENQPLIPETGGVAVILGSYVGVSLVSVLAGEGVTGPMYYAALSAILGAGVVGLIDDMFGLRKRTKALFPFILSLPLGAVVYASGDRTLLGADFGILIVFAVALGVTSAGNAANMLEGFNGLGAGLGILMAFTLILISFLRGAEEGLFLLFPLLGALFAFLAFNRYPARVFPGDSMTLFAGATLACAAIISTPPLKSYGALLFAPMILEFVLKARGHFQAENYGRIGPDGRLTWEGRVESLSHLIMRGRSLREWEIVAAVWALEAAVCVAVILAVVAGL